MTVVVGLGANLGDRLAMLQAAARGLGAMPLARVLAASAVYESEAMGPPQPDYLNAALRLQVGLPLLRFFDACQALEGRLGRRRTQHWGPRCIDIDLLWWGGQPLQLPELQLPHPGLLQRAFALAPLLDVMPELRLELAPTLQRLGGHPAVWRQADWTDIAAEQAMVAADDGHGQP